MQSVQAKQAYLKNTFCDTDKRLHAYLTLYQQAIQTDPETETVLSPPTQLLTGPVNKPALNFIAFT